MAGASCDQVLVFSDISNGRVDFDRMVYADAVVVCTPESFQGPAVATSNEFLLL